MVLNSAGKETWVLLKGIKKNHQNMLPIKPKKIFLILNRVMIESLVSFVFFPNARGHSSSSGNAAEAHVCLALLLKV